MEKKKHMIFAIDAEKAFQKLRHTFIVKTLNKLTTGEAYFTMTHAVYDRSQPSPYL